MMPKHVRDPRDVTIGAVLRTRRLARRMSLEQLGSACGVTYQQVQKYETGANRVSFSMLVSLAAALRCAATELVQDATAAADLGKAMPVDVDALRVVHALTAVPNDVRPGLISHFVGIAELHHADASMPTRAAGGDFATIGRA